MPLSLTLQASPRAHGAVRATSSGYFRPFAAGIPGVRWSLVNGGIRAGGLPVQSCDFCNCCERLRWVPGGHYWPGRYHGIIIKPDVGFLE